MADETFSALADGKVSYSTSCIIALVLIDVSQLDGQKAFMTGKLKTKGNMMLATKLGSVLEVCSHSIIYVPPTILIECPRLPRAKPSSNRCILLVVPYICYIFIMHSKERCDA